MMQIPDRIGKKQFPLFSKMGIEERLRVVDSLRALLDSEQPLLFLTEGYSYLMVSGCWVDRRIDLAEIFAAAGATGGPEADI